MDRLKGFGILFIILSLLHSCTINSFVRTKAGEIKDERKTSEDDKNLSERLKRLEESIEKFNSRLEGIEGYLKILKFRHPISTYKLPKEVLLCGERIPLEDKGVWENLDREFLIALGNEAQVLLWMKRSRRFFPYIEGKLKDMGLPNDLKYVTIVESTLRPEAVSISGAAGIWQFIPSTGELYGMRRNKTIDERFDFFKATDAALIYLKKLYDEFQSWILAMAAYNAGESRIRKEIELQRTKNYFYLDLPPETERYVYKIAAAKIILSNPEKYGFYLGEDQYYTPLQIDRVMIELKNPLPIVEISEALGYSYKDIKELNPHFQIEVIPPGLNYINLPYGSSDKFLKFLSSWESWNQFP